ncbi:MAG: FliM/FliN family flagellar motor switch protein [Pseudomonadota bacterium]
MSDENVIAKKIESDRKINAPLPRVNDVLAEFTRTIEKGARAYVGSVVEAMIMEVENKRFSDFLDAVSMPAMIGIVDIDGIDRAAAINFDLDLVYHVVDLRMGGLPTELPEFVARRPTAIDNAMCLPMVDIALEALRHGLRMSAGSDLDIAMSCDVFEHLPMMANIVPESADVLSIQASLDIGEAARSGNFEIVLPFSTLDRIVAKLKRAQSLSGSDADDAWAAHMLNVVLDTEIEVDAVLQTTQSTVGEIERLEFGERLMMTPGAAEAVSLEMTLPGENQPIASAKLGAFKNHKALKLNTDPDDDFIAPLRRYAQRPSA